MIRSRMMKSLFSRTQDFLIAIEELKNPPFKSKSQSQYYSTKLGRSGREREGGGGIPQETSSIQLPISEIF
jgi:hypothetical protein